MRGLPQGLELGGADAGTAGDGDGFFHRLPEHGVEQRAEAEQEELVGRVETGDEVRKKLAAAGAKGPAATQVTPL